MKLYNNAAKAILSRYFRDTRADAGLTQSQMAERLHISPRSYVELEYGRYLCSTCVFLIYCLDFGIDLESLMFEIDSAFSSIEEQHENR